MHGASRKFTQYTLTLYNAFEFFSCIIYNTIIELHLIKKKELFIIFLVVVNGNYFIQHNFTK